MRIIAYFEPSGYQRYVGGGGADAAVAVLLPPFADRVDADALAAFRASVPLMARPAGGLAPGERWKTDGVSWTPQTSLYAYVSAAIGDDQAARRWLSWLDAHRTPLGALPEKVLAGGEPAAVAPLGWTAAVVLLTLSTLEDGACVSATR